MTLEQLAKELEPDEVPVKESDLSKRQESKQIAILDQIASKHAISPESLVIQPLAVLSAWLAEEVGEVVPAMIPAAIVAYRKARKV